MVGNVLGDEMIYINRREFLKTSAAATMAASLPRGFARAEHAGGGTPNILFIMTDQQHAGMMSCAGNPWLKTPAMDSLAESGIRFAQACSANPVCVPSRTSMATGVMPCRLGAKDNDSGMRIRSLPEEVNNNSLGKLMKRAGYATFYGGKVHMCRDLVPQHAGYDAYSPDERDRLPDACLEFITQKRDQPFFAVASFINPHDICFADWARKGKDEHGVLELYRKAAALPEDELPPLPDNFAIPEGEPEAVKKQLSATAVTPSKTMREDYSERDWRIYRWIYCRLTEKVDREIGRILQGLKDAGLEENTLILFVSDHGHMDASHRLASKAFFYEESVGVPLILQYKGAIPAGRIDDRHLVSTGLDILPTFCDYAGVEKPAHCLGASLRALAEGKRVETWRSHIASENNHGRMIRSERHKYCAYEGGEVEESLVDLKTDPGEMRNLAGDPEFANVLAEHRTLLADWNRLSKDQDGDRFSRK
jgi:arylsulfatase A-like enzyme